MNEIQRIEEAYKRYGTDYSICFVDIDFFFFGKVAFVLTIAVITGD